MRTSAERILYALLASMLVAEYQAFPLRAPCLRSTLSTSQQQFVNPTVSLSSVLHGSAQDNERELVPVRRRGRKYYDEDDDDEEYGRVGSRYEDEEDDDDDEEYYEDYDSWLNTDEGEEYELFGKELIPNPILDSIDPDGAAERFPELARDPRFWFDMVLFFALLEFLSSIGPRNQFPLFP